MSNSESSFVSRLAAITGSNIQKTAGFVDAHPETTKVAALSKIASMSMEDIMQHDAFMAGFEARLAERMPEMFAAADQFIAGN